MRAFADVYLLSETVTRCRLSSPTGFPRFASFCIHFAQTFPRPSNLTRDLYFHFFQWPYGQPRTSGVRHLSTTR
jgi:hypothetical protein